VLRHVTQLAAAPVIVDRPGGIVHSERELRIIAPNTGDAKADQAAAVAVEFGVLRGLLDLTSPMTIQKAPGSNLGEKSLKEASADSPDRASANSRSEGGKKKWWPFEIALLAVLCSGGVSPATWRARENAQIAGETATFQRIADAMPAVALLHRLKSVVLKSALVNPALPAAAVSELVTKTDRLKPVLLGAEPAQGQFATGQGFRITDGTNFLAVDPCKAQTKFFASINQTANAQLVTGTVSKKIYVCSIHVVAAAATNVAVVEGTGAVCATGTAGMSGFGGATAATGWNFAANGGIAFGNGDSSLGAEGASGDNLCIFSSGSGQVSGGISYVVQ
jgi:hypothetical protein